MTIKADQRVAVVLEAFIRLLHHCGLPLEDLDLIHNDGPSMEQLIKQVNFRML